MQCGERDLGAIRLLLKTKKCLLELFEGFKEDSNYLATGGLFIVRENEESGGGIRFGFKHDEYLKDS